MLIIWYLVCAAGVIENGKNVFKKDWFHGGFTLVELLIAMFIIGILAAVALTEYNRFRLSAYNAITTYDVKAALAQITSFF